MAPRILIVEDEEPLVMLLRYNLEAEGYEVDSAGNGEEAALKLAEAIPDLVVLDWMIPNVSGIELCRRLRASPETARLPIIMLTARGEETERVRGLATGADDLVPGRVLEVAADQGVDLAVQGGREQQPLGVAVGLVEQLLDDREEAQVGHEVDTVPGGDAGLLAALVAAVLSALTCSNA